jgi:hypothetical protein
MRKTIKKNKKHVKKNITKKRIYMVGAGQTEQDSYINSIFTKIKSNHSIEELITQMPQLCIEFKRNIVEQDKYDFTINIRSFTVISILLPFFMKYQLYSFDGAPYDKIDQLHNMARTNVFLGSVLKQHELTSLTPYPEKSLILLNSCSDNDKYCAMDPKYLIIDNNNAVIYLCDNENIEQIIRIRNPDDLLSVKDGQYLYSILPDQTLCLFKGHHSAGACGQPVICAGNISVLEHKIKKIDNSSGHYSPPPEMLMRSIELLKTRNLITNNGLEESSNSDDYFKKYIF